MHKLSDVNKVTLFGAGGFIGSHLTKALVSHGGYELRCLDLTDEKLQKIVPEGGYEFFSCNIESVENQRLMEEMVASSDVVVDLVAYANPSIYMEKPINVVRLNLFENLKIVDLCMKHDTYLVQFSTCEVYGKSDGKGEPFSEDTTDLIVGPVNNHRWIYSCAKQMLERILHAYGLDGHIDYTIIRPFNFIGPEMDYLITSPEDGKPRVFPEFMSSLLYDKPMVLVDGGHNYRTFTYIDDAVEAVAMVLSKLDVYNNQIVNVGTPGNEIKIRDMALLMKRIYHELTGKHSTAEVMEVFSKDYYGEGYEDCDRRIPDVSKLTLQGWRPRFDLDETLRRSIAYYLDREVLAAELSHVYKVGSCR